ncbi:MAG TPA: tetratricopeptide repeat protein, partial [Sphingomicrobium sp.]|nr:tetratricopeptide repeat protein [Sphingomicrobium sp.]
DAADPLAALERRAQADPDNAGAWQELGFAYFELGRFADAATAYDKATRADPDSAVLWSSLGEARVMASARDPMPPAALEAFRKAAALDSGDPRARYFLAVQKDLAGDHPGAIADWLALLADTPPGAPWEADLRRTIEQVGKINKIETASRLAAVKQPVPAGPPPTAVASLPGPTAEQVQDASKLSPSQQMDMGRSMVERLEGRLKTDPSNVGGWIMLMRSRMTLKEPQAAKAALAAAIAANPGERARLEAEARALGVPN